MVVVSDDVREYAVALKDTEEKIARCPSKVRKTKKDKIYPELPSHPPSSSLAVSASISGLVGRFDALKLPALLLQRSDILEELKKSQKVFLEKLNHLSRRLAWINATIYSKVCHCPVLGLEQGDVEHILVPCKSFSLPELRKSYSLPAKVNKIQGISLPKSMKFRACPFQIQHNPKQFLPG